MCKGFWFRFNGVIIKFAQSLCAGCRMFVSNRRVRMALFIKTFDCHIHFLSHSDKNTC